MSHFPTLSVYKSEAIAENVSQRKRIIANRNPNLIPTLTKSMLELIQKVKE
jgi:hypothetical protein